MQTPSRPRQRAARLQRPRSQLRRAESSDVAVGAHACFSNRATLRQETLLLALLTF